MRVVDIDNWLAWKATTVMAKRSIYGGDWIDLANPGNSYDPSHNYLAA